jgi:hypothetical protein
MVHLYRKSAYSHKKMYIIYLKLRNWYLFIELRTLHTLIVALFSLNMWYKIKHTLPFYTNILQGFETAFQIVPKIIHLQNLILDQILQS